MNNQNMETWRDARPAFLGDVAAAETWLEDWAAKGYRLVGFRGMNGVFVKDEPKTCRYRLEPLARKEKAPDPDRVAVYGEMGWMYAATMGKDFHIWRCDDPAAPELDTDPVVQAAGYGYLKRRLLHWLKTGIPLDRPAPYRWQRRLSKILTALILCIFCSNLVSDLLGGFWPMWDPEQAVYVDLAVLEPGASVEHISTETKVHELAPRMYVTNQSTADFESSLYTEYYRLRAAALVPALERDLLEWWSHYGDGPMEKLEEARLDGFWWRDNGGS